MPKPSVKISVKTYKDVSDKTFGRRIISALLRCSPLLEPEGLSYDEAYDSPFVSEEDFAENWWALPRQSTVTYRTEFEGPLWRRRNKLVSQGQVQHSCMTIKGNRAPGFISFDCRWSPEVDFASLFDPWFEILEGEMGMVHVFTDHERIPLGNFEDRSFQSGSFGGPARPGIPNIGWCLAFGPENAHEVDPALLREHGYNVVEKNGARIVQVTDKLSDVVDDFEAFAKRRQKIRRLFRDGLFRPLTNPTPYNA